jgi:hypothetical protein
MLIQSTIILCDTADKKSERRYKFWNYYYYYYYYYYYSQLMVAMATCSPATDLQSEARMSAETIDFPFPETSAFALWPTQLSIQWLPWLLLWQQGRRSVRLSTQLYAAPKLRMNGALPLLTMYAYMARTEICSPILPHKTFVTILKESDVYHSGLQTEYV